MCCSAACSWSSGIWSLSVSIPGWEGGRGRERRGRGGREREWGREGERERGREERGREGDMLMGEESSVAYNTTHLNNVP